MKVANKVVCSLLVGTVLCLATAEVGGAKAPVLDVRHRARAVQPGEVVVVEVRPSEPLVTVRATVFGTTTRFFPVGNGDLWVGLIGIDIETKPGEYAAAVRATTGRGDTVRAAYDLIVAPKKFPTRHLSVNPRFIDPPADVLDRIQREATRQAEIFATASQVRQWRGGFLRPVLGEATSSFGRRSVYNGESRSPHSGTDFRSAAGTPIRAPNAGTIVLAGEQYFSGNIVIIDHGWGLYSYFAHLSAIDVAEGDRVESGDVVGLVGATGRVTGPHLHWTVRLNEARVDPLSLMGLLPTPAAE